MNVFLPRPRQTRAGTQRSGDSQATVSCTSHNTETQPTLGWLPALSVCGACALLLAAIANDLARNRSELAPTLFWTSLLVLIVPCAARLSARAPSRHERIGVVVLVGIGLYLVKIFHSPLAFTFPDELQHWRTINNILDHGHLFSWNPILPISPLYPGLENATSALIALTGLPIFPAALVLVGAARLVLMLSLYLFFETITRSPRLASIGALLYIATPNFLFLLSLYAYQSLALPLTALILLAAAYRWQAENCDRAGLNLIVVLCAGAIATTHHVTMFALLVFLILWAALNFIMGGTRQRSPYGVLALVIVLGLGWIAYIATLTITYLGWHLWSASGEVQQIVVGGLMRRQLFQTSTGQSAPIGEQVLGLTAVILVTLGVLYGALQVWRHQCGNPLMLALAVAALAYPATLPLRLTVSGVAVVGRAPEFLFVGVGLILAFAEDSFWRNRAQWLKTLLFCGYTMLVITGGIAIGWPPPSSRLPGPYRVAADTRSVELQGVSAAQWMHEYLGPGHRLIADWMNGHLAAAYGDQMLVTSSSEGLNVAMVVLSSKIGLEERSVLMRGQIRYVLTDLRLSRGLPQTGFYFDGIEPGAFQHREPPDRAVLEKFDNLDGVSRIFDSGDIRLYDLKDQAVW